MKIRQGLWLTYGTTGQLFDGIWSHQQYITLITTTEDRNKDHRM